jgi:hypothetical protein
VRSFRAVLDGEHDDLPESAFFMKGSIDDVVKGADKGEGKKDEKEQREQDADADEGSSDKKDES